MNESQWLLLAACALGLYGAGQVWLVQLSSYRLWPYVGNRELGSLDGSPRSPKWGTLSRTLSTAHGDSLDPGHDSLGLWISGALDACSKRVAGVSGVLLPVDLNYFDSCWGIKRSR